MHIFSISTRARGSGTSVSQSQRQFPVNLVPTGFSRPGIRVSFQEATRSSPAQLQNS